MALLANTRIYGNLIVDDKISITGSEESINTSSGALVVSGGIGVAGNISAGAVYTDNYFYSDGTSLLFETQNQIVSAYTHANSAYAKANSVYTDATIAGSYANSAYLHANAAFEIANTGGFSTDSWARDQANTANILAQSAYDTANGISNTVGTYTITGAQYLDYGWVTQAAAPVLFDYGTL